MSKNNCKYLFSVRKTLGHGESEEVGIKDNIKIKTVTNQFAYVLKHICQSLSYGNTDQVGRSAWNGFIRYIQNGVATFVNEWNAKYIEGKDPNINPTATPDFLPNGIPEFINTTTHNNSYDISIGIVTLSLIMEEVMAVYEKAKETEERKIQNHDPGAAASAGGTSAAHPGPAGDSGAAHIPEYTQEQKDFRHMREMLRTLSSAMDMPMWDNCTNLDDPCVMPNVKRVPDIAVVVDPVDLGRSLSYPILIGEVLGKKDKRPRNNQLYEGYNATMQCLVFGPRAYYFEIATTDAALTILQKDPAEGTITAKRKDYELRHKNKLLELINDLSAAFLDKMINLRPIAHITAVALRKRNYQDFLSPPPGRGKKLQLHCWHVFVPDYHHTRGEIPDEYNPEVDKELVQRPKYLRNQIPDCTRDQLDNSVIEVEEFNIKDNTDFFDDVSFCHGHRNPFGTPMNMKGQQYQNVKKEKAKKLKHQMIIEDVKKILKMVADYFHDHIVRKKITETLPEINPGMVDTNVWVMSNDTRAVYLKWLENENVVITSKFPDPESSEDEDGNVDPPPPPQREEEEVIAKLKFTSYTSNQIQKYYTQYIEKKKTWQAEHPEEEYVFPDSQWTPGKPSEFTKQLRKMHERGDSGDQLSKKLTYDEPTQEAPEEEIQQGKEREEAERAEHEKQAREREEAERAEHEKQEREHEEAERAEREQQARECEEAEHEKQAREREEAERAEHEKQEREREEAERAKREQQAREREEAERAEHEKQAREREEAERAEHEKQAREHEEAERAEREKQAREHEEAERAKH